MLGLIGFIENCTHSISFLSANFTQINLHVQQIFPSPGQESFAECWRQFFSFKLIFVVLMLTGEKRKADKKQSTNGFYQSQTPVLQNNVLFLFYSNHNRSRFWKMTDPPQLSKSFRFCFPESWARGFVSNIKCKREGRLTQQPTFIHIISCST